MIRESDLERSASTATEFRVRRLGTLVVLALLCGLLPSTSALAATDHHHDVARPSTIHGWQRLRAAPVGGPAHSPAARKVTALPTPIAANGDVGKSPEFTSHA